MIMMMTMMRVMMLLSDGGETLPLRVRVRGGSEGTLSMLALTKRGHPPRLLNHTPHGSYF